MNAALLLAWILAQAEAAPTPTATPTPPATPLPLAQAIAPDGAQALGVFARVAYRPAGSEAQLGPSTGFSIGGSYQRRLVRLDAPDAPTLDVGLALDFFHDQFQTAVARAGDGAEPNQNQRLITHTGVSLSPLLAVPVSRLRFWLSGGAGVAIAYFSTPEPALSPGNATAVQPQLTGGAGITVTVRPNIDVGVRADFTHPLTHPRFTPTQGPTVTVWGDLLDFGAGLFYRF